MNGLEPPTDAEPAEPAETGGAAGGPERTSPAVGVEPTGEPTDPEPDTDPGTDPGAEPGTEQRADQIADHGADDGDGVQTASETQPAGADEQSTGPAAGQNAADEAGGRPRPAGHAVRASVLIGVLFALLGFGLAVQVHTNSSTSGLASARQDDLVRILDDLSSREDRLRQQISSLQQARRELSSSGDKASVALSEARNRSTALAILAGTAPARGPGVQITINDPGHRLDAEDLLDVVEELRAAGAEAFQVGSVRIGMSSAFTEDSGVVLADGTTLRPPYVVLAIGDPGTLATALKIPGGVVASVRNAGGKAVVTQHDELVISALRPLEVPHYASPAAKHGN